MSPVVDIFPLANGSSLANVSPLAMVPDITPFIAPGVFYGLALVAILASIVAATAPKIVHAAFALMAALFGIAGLYFMLGADFIGLAQVIVYVGGILVLLVFGVLLTGRTRQKLGLDEAPQIVFPAVVGGLVFLGLSVAIYTSSFNASQLISEPTPSTAPIGRAFLDPNQYLIPFELSSVLLLAALIGAAYLARRRRS